MIKDNSIFQEKFKRFNHLKTNYILNLILEENNKSLDDLSIAIHQINLFVNNKLILAYLSLFINITIHITTI